MRREHSWDWVFALITICGCAIGGTSQAQELCGIDSIFYNGFETTTSNPATTSSPGAIVSPGVATSINGPALSVTVTYPANSATVNGPTTEIAGTFTGPTDTGITVNGVVAYTDGGNFLASAVPLQAGSNTINVTATTITGGTASASIGVTQGSASLDAITLSVARPESYAPFLVSFTPNVGTLPGGATLKTLSIDYNGDGIDDVTNPPPGTPLTYLAAQPNLYAARLTVIDSNNVTYTAYAHYLVEDLTRQSGMLCDVYGYMKQRLTAQDSAGALTAIDPNAQNEYQALFTNNASTLPAYVANLGSIVDGYLTGNTATFIVVRQNTDQTLSGFHIEFSQSADGTWRIAGM
jgi:type IV secretory pathway VirB2 component (pilin)